jgi:hypothetical protein
LSLASTRARGVELPTPGRRESSRGRPKGSPNKMDHDLMTMVMETAAELGFLRKDPETKELVATGEGGARGYLKWIGINRPDRFVALMARVAPKHVFADVTHQNDALTEAEIEAELRERGLPLELLPMLLNVPEDHELDFDEDPDPYHMMKDVTPASTNGGGKLFGAPDAPKLRPGRRRGRPPGSPNKMGHDQVLPM